MVKVATLITTEPGKVDEVEGRVKALEGVDDAFTVTGRADIIALFAGTFEEISKIIGEIGKIEGVKTTETLVELVE